MQAPGLKHTTPSQIIGLALVLGLAASITLNVVMLIRSTDGARQPSVAQVDAMAAIGTPYVAHVPADSFVQASGLITEGQVQTPRSSTPVGNSWYFDMAFGQIDIRQVQADQRFAPTARDRFILEPAH